MNKVEQLLGLPLEIRVSVLIWMVQHAQSPVRGLQLLLSCLQEKGQESQWKSYSILCILSAVVLRVVRGSSPSADTVRLLTLSAPVS